MNRSASLTNAAIRLPKLAATAIILLGLSTNTNVDMAPRTSTKLNLAQLPMEAPHHNLASANTAVGAPKLDAPKQAAIASVSNAPAVSTPPAANDNHLALPSKSTASLSIAYAVARITAIQNAAHQIALNMQASALIHPTPVSAPAATPPVAQTAAVVPVSATLTPVKQTFLADMPSPDQNAAFERLSVEGLHALSPSDADFYRAAFVAQAANDWQSADMALAQVKDRRLIGHVLADRYLRSKMTLDEAKAWMAAYGELHEADDIYAAAQKLHGFAAAHISSPARMTSWEGNNRDYGTPLGFRISDLSDDSHKTHGGVKISTALRHGEPTIARELLATEIQRGALSIDEASEATGRIAAAFYYDGQIERARPMAHTAAQSGTPLGLWIDGMAAWKQSDYVGATRSFASLAQAPRLSPWDKSAAAFWAYRGASKMGDVVQAHHWLSEAAKNPRTFYGYLASSLDGQHASASWKLPEFTSKQASLLSASNAGWQSIALVQAGRIDMAEEELRRVDLNNHHDLQVAALALAEKAHMPALVMQLGSVVTNDNGQPYEAAMYPLPPWQPADGFKVDRALLFALIKRESQFDPDAVSGSGACGLMQIMPSTARLISDDASNAHGSAHKCPDKLFDPATNMAVGQKYVRVLAGQPMIGDNLMLLLAAYNSGPGNLSRWLDSEDRRDPLLFLESLPMHETRDYVQQVLLHYWMYRSRLSEPENSVAQLAHGEWPRYALNDNMALPKNALRRADARTSLKMASLDPSKLRAAK